MARDSDGGGSPGTGPGADVTVADDEEFAPDPISDPGLEGGVDAPNESDEEPGVES